MSRGPTFRSGPPPDRPLGGPASLAPAASTTGSGPGGPTGSGPGSDVDERSAAVARRRLSIEQTRTGFRRVPNSGEIARRRLLLRWTKWILPAAALLLLVSIAIWPEIDRSMNSARIGLKQVTQVQVDSGRMIGPRYHGLDGHNRPYMITADEAQQASVSTPPAAGAPIPGKSGAGNSGPGNSGAGKGGGGKNGSSDRINLDRPVADTLSQGGSWIRISARNGVYMQHGQLLDLDRDVTLYRDDGIMMTSPVAGLDLRRGVIASDQWVHAEGPFGVLDAQGYLLSQRDGTAQFRGPGRLILNDDRVAHQAAAMQPAATAPAPTTTGAAR